MSISRSRTFLVIVTTRTCQLNNSAAVCLSVSEIRANPPYLSSYFALFICPELHLTNSAVFAVTTGVSYLLDHSILQLQKTAY